MAVLLEMELDDLSFLLSPLNDQIPFVHDTNSSFVMSLTFCAFLFHSFLYKTTISSTGAMTYGADADLKLPHAVRREILPSFQIMVGGHLHHSFLQT